jgi:hypothetical protein
MKFVMKGPGDESPREYSASQVLRLMVAHVKDAQEGVLVAQEGATVYVGRQGGAKRGRFGNPFSHDPRSTAPNKVSSRKEAVEAFAVWVNQPGQSDLREDITASLRRKVLLCHCQRQADVSPACHAEVLVRLANPDLAELEFQEQRSAPPRHLELKNSTQFKAWARDLGMLDAPRVLITGDRNFRAADLVAESVREFGPGALLIEGEARGADELARDSALEIGMPVAGFPAEWDPKPSTPPSWIKARADGKRYVPRAGVLRNQRMAECEPTVCVAFHDDIRASRGTRNMVEQAWALGVPIRLIGSDGHEQRYTPEGPGTPLPEALSPYQPA